MTDQPAQIPLRLAVDEQALNRSQQGVALLSQRLAELRTNAQTTGATVDKASAALGNGIAKATPLMDRLADSARKAAEAAKAASGNWNDLRTSIFQAGQASQQASGGLNVQGLRRTGGALSQLGLGAIGGPVSQIGDIAQIAKEANELGASLKNLPGILGNVATEGTALGGSLGGVLAVAGPLILAIGGIAAGIAIFNKSLEDAKRALQDTLDMQLDYYKFIQTATKEDVEKRKRDDESSLKAASDALAETQSAIQRARTEYQKAFGVLLPDDRRILDKIPVFAQLYEQLDKDQAAADKANADLGRLNGAILNNSTATNDATAAVLANADAEKKRKMQDYEDSQLSADAAKKKAEQLKVTIDSDLGEIETLKASGDTSQKTQDKIKALNAEVDDLGKEFDRLNGIFIPAAERAKELADAVKEHAKTLEQANKAANEARKAEEDRLKGIATTQQKYNDTIEKIDDESAQKKIEIEQKYQDALVNAAQRAVEAAQDALRKLGDEQQKLAIDFGRNEQDAARKAAYDNLTVQIKAQQEETTALIDHQRKLEDIRKQNRNQELSYLLDRNFLGLLQSRLSTSQQMQTENTSYLRTSQDRARARQEQTDDSARQREFERQQRLIAYKQAIEDARRNYELQLRDEQIAKQRAILQARQAEQKELEMAQQTAREKLRIAREVYTQELKLAIMGAEQRLKVEAQIQRALVNQAMSFIAGPRGQQPIGNMAAVVHRAFGGPLAAGQPAVVNENGGESFGGMRFPNSPGLFIPFRAGNVTSGGNTYNFTIPINGAQDVALVQRAVVDVLKQVIR